MTAAYSPEALRLLECARTIAIAGGLGTYMGSPEEHEALLFSVVANVQIQGRKEVTWQDIMEVKKVRDAWHIKFKVAVAGDRLGEVERKWREERERRAAS